MTVERKLGWRGKMLLSLLSPVVFLGLVEIGLRIGGFRYEPWLANLEGRSYVELREREVFAPHPRLIWTLKPSTRLNVPSCGFVGMATNSLGLRDEELPGPRGPNDFRVLCIGDSVTFGLGLKDGETWPDRMQEELDLAPELEGRDVNVFNAGIPGWSAVQGMRNLERLADFEPDVIVFWCGLPDAHDMFDLPDSAQIVPVKGVPRAMAKLWSLRVFQLVQKVVTGVRQTGADGTRVGRAEFRAYVDQLRELERSGGPKVLFVREPECCDQTVRQMREVVTQAEGVGAEVVLAPGRLLSWVLPVPAGYSVTGNRTTHEGRPAIAFPRDSRFPGCEKIDTVIEFSEFREDYERLARLKVNLDRILDELPEGSLLYEDLFGEAGTDVVFMDNCHLTPRGAMLAADTITREVLRLVRVPRRE